ncbi:MAG: J domain-containing protein, partial [Chroococcales cyanobacterium]
MSLTIQHGLFQLDAFTDYHAILGIPLNADFKQIRKRYLKIAQSLHPDTCKVQNEAEREQATQILSKLVNPAYEKLSKSESYQEYQLVLSQTGKRLAVEGKKVFLKSDLAMELSKAGPNLETLYSQSVQKLASQQYKAIADILNVIAQLSELNLVYLMEKEGSGIAKSPRQTVPPTQITPSSSNGNSEQAKTTAQPEPGKPHSPTASYIRRAKSYIERNNFAKAVLELRDGLKIDPNDSQCHSLL